MNGENGCALELVLDNDAYQAILKASRAIAFAFDSQEGREYVSPHVGELLAGNYNGRFLSQTMLEDGVIHPDDVEKSVLFRELVNKKQAREMTLRLKTPQGGYRWFRMVMTCQTGAREEKRYIGMLFDVDEGMQYQEQLRRRAERDMVSDVYHRVTFLAHVRELLEKKRETPCFLFQFDIDRFKLVNEMYGTQVGDEVLNFIGGILKRLAQPGDFFGRLRDDVFCMCTGRSREDTIALVQQIHQEARQYRIAFRFFLPTGIVEISPDCTDTASGLSDKATLAQKSIKGNYLHEYCFYEPAMGARLNREHFLISEMELALKEEQFETWFQPQYDLRDGRMIGAETLARWRHPRLGLISPMEFIPLFEHNGFIIDLDEYIWERVCRHIQSWRASGFSPPPISVNVSRTHLYDGNFAGKLLALCQKYDIPTSLLWLEITESAYTEQPQELFDLMKEMRQAGFRFAMDDFGSGYSSLNILKDIPVDMIKFDLRFLDDSNGDRQAGQIILKNSVRLVGELGLSCVVEGVETGAQAKFLQNIGCHRAQGYYFARPMPAEQFERTLRRQPSTE